MLGVIIVAYKNTQRTIDFINNQLSNLNPEHVTVVVNNGSTVDSCRLIAESCCGIVCEPDDVVGKHPVYIVHVADNLGFAKGNNIGVRFLSRNYACEHLLFSNDDIIIDKNTDVSPLITKLDADKSIGAIGPDIVSLDGKHQSPHHRIVTPYRQIAWMLFPWLRRKLVYRNDISSIPVSPEGKCYWVSGAFFLMRFDHFSAVNGFDPDTFLYSEEPILAERLKRLGKTMYFDPSIKVTHTDGGTTKNAIGNNGIRRLVIESNCIYYRKYLKTPKIIVALYKHLATKQ